MSAHAPTLLPASLKVREVGPRDGFQNEPELRPRRRDPSAGRCSRGADRDLDPEDVTIAVLAPNQRSLDGALTHAERIDEVIVFLSASETHNRKNINRPVADSLATVERRLPRIADAGLRPLASVATSFGCPYESHVPATRVYELAERMAAAGAQEISFGDTTGMANPRQVREFYAGALQRLPSVELTAHFHNTRGQGLANALAALESGVESFESSFGSWAAARCHQARPARS